MECCIRLKVKVHHLELSVLNGEWDNSCRSVKFMIDSQQQGSLSFYGSQKGDEGADTDLMIQFCLPNGLLHNHIKKHNIVFGLTAHHQKAS